MDDFGILARDFGFKPQGKSAPMKSDTGDVRTRPQSSSSASSFAAANDDPIFNDVFGGPPKFTNNNSRSTTAMSDIDYDSIFKTNEAKTKSTSSNLPVFDKPVYDDDIFDGLPGVKSKSMYSSSTRFEDNVFASMSSSSPKQSDHFDDLFAGFGSSNRYCALL